jgi:hypothetical protein
MKAGLFVFNTKLSASEHHKISDFTSARSTINLNVYGI